VLQACHAVPADGLKRDKRHAATPRSSQKWRQIQQSGFRRQNMPATVRRLTRNRPGKMSIIDYSLIGVLTAYGALQILLVLVGKVPL
jgi:hypothetical protein